MDSDCVNAAELVQQLTDSLESAAKLPLFNEYKSVIKKALGKAGDNWKEEFRQTKTDFERVCFLLRAIESINGQHKQGADKLGLPAGKEILPVNGKSDGISRQYLSYGRLAIGEGDKETSLVAITKSVFYAASYEQLSKALVLRCRLLHHLKLYDQAIEDGETALALSCPISEIGNVHLNLAHCYQIRNMLPESMSHYTQALSAFLKTNIQQNLGNSLRIVKGLDECLSTMIKNKPQLYEPSWICFRSKDIENLVPRNLEVNTNSCSNANNSKLLSSINGAVRLKYTGSTESGWTMELNRDVSAGEILMVEKPWAMSLWKERTKYCYFCCKRCHNLRPCPNCPHVGFCSKKCETNAKNSAETSNGGNKHIYDCQGLYPLIVLGNDTIHTAFNCLVKVPPNQLLDYIYSTESYVGGKGHQAFMEGEEHRRVPPEVFDPSDYSAIAFLTTRSDNRRCGTNWMNTKASVFLTYCLYLAGYPMQWFDETDIFFSEPSPTRRSKVIPASWISACLLCHIQAVYVNAFSVSETIRRGVRSKRSKMEEFGTAIYPTISLINHSCNPNVSIRFADKGVAFLYANQPLRAGSEISLSYYPLFCLMSTHRRREFLLSRYYFLCKCEACKNDWNESKLVAPEKLVCQNCKEDFLEKSEGCPKCRSLETVKMIKNLRKEVIPQLKQRIYQNAYTFDDLKYTAMNIDSAAPHLQGPSSILMQLQDLYDNILSRFFDNQTIELWANVDTS